MKLLSRVRLFATPWTVAYQAPPSMEFSRQEYWSGLPFPSPRDLPNPGIESRSSALQADALPSEPPGKPLGSGLNLFFLVRGDLADVDINKLYLGVWKDRKLQPNSPLRLTLSHLLTPRSPFYWAEGKLSYFSDFMLRK